MYSSLHVQSNHPPNILASLPHIPPYHHPQQAQNQQQQQQVQQQQPNGHHVHPAQLPPPSHRQAAPAKALPLRVSAIPSIHIAAGQLIHGDAQSSSERSYTPIKVVGDGSFGTVWLVDWHSELPPNTPLSPMQCGAGARPEWAGKRLVALKRMKKRWEGGWDECRKLKELESLRAIPFHPNIIPLYDFFLLPTTKELYFVFESMEGNLYQLIKSRKGRPLAGGLVSSIFRQVVSGLYHIHAHGYFHRDMKPENLLVTTTGLFDYRSVSPVAPPNAPPEYDVVVIVKLADFGLARETKSKPPYTEYVSTRWYRAPEVLLRSRDYSNPVDMWALGTIMAELINLKPLFPGSTEIDQVARICDVLGDPSDEYGVDERGVSIGGGKWVKGIKMARGVGYTFPKLKPTPIRTLFDRNVPRSMIECISDLLKYDPDERLTCLQCLEHPYIAETTPGNTPPGPKSTAPPSPLHVNTNGTPGKQTVHLPGLSNPPSMNSMSPRTVPPSHSNSPASGKPHFSLNGNGTQPPPPLPQPHRVPFYPMAVPGASASTSTDLLESMAHAQATGLASHLSNRQSDGSLYPSVAPHSAVPSSVFSTGADRISGGNWSDANTDGHVQGAPHLAAEWNLERDPDAMDVSAVSPAPPEQVTLAAAMPNAQSPAPMDVTMTHEEHAHAVKLDHSGIVQPVPLHAVARQAQQQAQPHAQPQQPQASGSKLKLGLGFAKKSSKWGLSGMFGHGDKAPPMPPLYEQGNNATSTTSTPSLKRTASSTDSHSLSELSPVGGEREQVSVQVVEEPAPAPMDARARRKEAERVEREAELARRALAQKRIREQARAVMQKRSQLTRREQELHGADVEWETSQNSAILLGASKPKPKARTGAASQAATSSATVNAAGGRFRSGSEGPPPVPVDYDNWRDMEQSRTKARRRDLDDDHSMSSSDMQSTRMSVISFATVESDPSSSRLRQRPSMFGLIPRMQSTSSLRTSFGDDFATSPRSSNSPSLEQQFVNDFDSRTSFSSYDAARSSISETSSPPQLHMLSLSSPQQLARANLIHLPPIHNHPHQHLRVHTPGSPFEYGQFGQIQAQPPSPAIAPHSAINPIFKVPPLPSQPMDHSMLPPQNSLPPFSQIAAVAGSEPLDSMGRTPDS